MDRRALDELFTNATQSKHVPGVVAICRHRDGLLYEGAFGQLDTERGDALPLDAVFWWASMTKVCTTIAAMQLVEQDKLALDAPIDTYLPKLNAPQVLEGSEPDGTPKLRAARTPITMRNLLNNTAGYGYTTWNQDLLAASFKLQLGFMPADWDEVVRTPLLFDPGTQWAYGVSSDIAGLAVEAVSGMKLSEYFARYIFEPLGMKDVTYEMGDERRARMPSLYTRQSETEFFQMPRTREGGEVFCGGGGGLSGPARDFLRLLEAILHGGSLDGHRILTAESVSEMSRNQIGEINVEPMTNCFPAMSGVLDFFPGMTQKFGLGFLINTETSQHGRSAGGLAWGGLCNTYFFIDPEKGIAGLLFAQMFPFMDPKVLELFGAFEAGLSAS